MNTTIESYPQLSETHLTELRKTAWNYSREIHRSLVEGCHASEAISQSRHYYDVVVWELERLGHTIGGPGCARRAAVTASFAAIDRVLTKNSGDLAPTMRDLGDALMVPRAPKVYTFTLQGKGWWSINLIALYITWARKQHRLLVRCAKN